MDIATALDSLSTLLTSLSEAPYSLELHAENIKLSSLPELAEQFEGAAKLFMNYYAATDHVWLPVLQKKLRCLGIPEDFETSEEPSPVSLQGINTEALMDVLESFRVAENDYLSMTILRMETKLLMLLHASHVSESPNPELEPLLSEGAVRSAMDTIISQGIWHPTEGHTLWELQIAWELACLAQKDPNSPQRDNLRAHVESLHLQRLKQPHPTHEATLQSYSAFVTAYYGPEEYESRLVSASKLRIGPAKAWDKKEPIESALGASPSRDNYQEYISNEQRQKSHHAPFVHALYDCAISDFAGRRWEAVVDGSDPYAVEEANAALRSFWRDYIDYVRSDANEDRELVVIQRAVRSVPDCGAIWAKYIRAIERHSGTSENQIVQEESVTDVYTRALSTSLVQKNVAQILPLVLAKAGYEKRHLDGEENLQALVRTLEDGISMVRNATKTGDPQLTLETFLAGILTGVEPPLTENALEMWRQTAKYYKTSSLAWSQYSKLLIAQHDYKRARVLFRDLAFKNIDWPEAIWQLWMEFEHLHGSVEDIEYCLQKVNHLSNKLEKKRAQEAAEAQKAWLDASRLTGEPPTANSQATEIAGEPMSGSGAEESQRHNEKKRGVEPTHDVPSKRIKLDEKAALKRDRENTTVFVSGLAAGASEDDLVALFNDCGDIREVKVTELTSSIVATVEFFERESVPAALTKDKKRLQAREIAVHLAWQSTLYVTNFSETADDTSIRELFGQHGEIFDVRWPSKKYKGTRRFCYVQYTSPAAASSALSLHKHEYEPGRNLTVYISNPERKQERSDVSVNAREIYVAGLSRSVTRNDLEVLFESFGSIKDIRLQLDEKGNVKGFAFVEFEDKESANAALAANNLELRRRRIAVTLADTRVQPHQRGGTLTDQDRRSRTLRVKNLPPRTQEGLLQQTLEKHAKITRIEVFSNKNEAVIEIDSVAEAGRLLLRSEPIIFDDRELQLIEEDRPAFSRESTRSTSKFVPRGIAGRPRAGLGSKKNTNLKEGVSSFRMPASSPSAGKDQDDFRRMLNPAT